MSFPDLEDRESISAKIVQVLKDREHRNTQANGLKYQKLSHSAKVCIQNNGPSKTFFQHFFGYYADKGCLYRFQQKRVAQYTEEAVNEHFFAPGAGLEDTLILHGIMDPITKLISDPKRLLNRDETPQFMDFNSLRGNNIRKRVSVKGKSSVLPKAENRECVALDVIMDLSGFLYGAHLMLARETLTETLCPDELEVFDSKIHEHQKLSTYGLLTLNQSGCQTGSTLLQRHHMLDLELIARGVTRPVVEMTDNHDSRYDDNVLEFCQSKGIIQWSEKSNTSGKFQALDQVNRLLHMEFEKGVREFKRERLFQLNLTQRQQERPLLDISDMKVNTTDFIRILTRRQEGQCRRYYKRKLAATRDLAAEWEMYETSPIEQGLLSPDVLPPLPPKASKGRLSDSNGSFQFNDILGKKRAKRAEQQAVREQTEFAALQRDLAREGRDAANARAAAAKAQAARELQEAWEKCGGGCTCPVLFVNMVRVICPVFKMKKCQICGDIKKSKCSKTECKRASASAA
ncbi:hypothetical protein CYMTET_57074 [Cymbomonas tetramitiformis]|uniref:Uncharacterized protein n=1 Tax=Cymbomonas tetramitiformis TaxID=36881 RepID=A0AAE0EN32_9CHLO|nr:hypothetical protein CYMTET_57074 [Cymbomonas tetramitiformis]